MTGQQAVESAVDAYLQRDAGLCQYVRRNETAISTAQCELECATNSACR
jgi:phosphate transport system protein